MEPLQWASIALVCLLGAASPGPSLLIVLRNTLPNYRLQGYLCAISHGFAVFLYAITAVFGLGLVFASTDLYKLLLWSSCFFLGWMGMQLIINKPNALSREERSMGRHSCSTAAIQGFAVAFLNPKLAAFFLAIFSQFLQPSLHLTQKLWMAILAGVIDALWYCLVVTWITRPAVIVISRGARESVDKLFGLVLVLLALSIIWS